MQQLRRERETDAEGPERGGWKRAKFQAEERTKEKSMVASSSSASRERTSLSALLSHKVKEETNDAEQEEAPVSSSKSRKVKSEDEDSIAFELSTKRRVTVRKWRGTLYVDIREFYDDNGTSKPGKKGEVGGPALDPTVDAQLVLTAALFPRHIAVLRPMGHALSALWRRG